MIHKSMSLKYEPSSGPLHTSVKYLFLNCAPATRGKDPFQTEVRGPGIDGTTGRPTREMEKPRQARQNRKEEGVVRSRKVDIRLPGKWNSNFHGARPVHLIITMIK